MGKLIQFPTQAAEGYTSRSLEIVKLIVRRPTLKDTLDAANRLLIRDGAEPLHIVDDPDGEEGC